MTAPSAQARKPVILSVDDDPAVSRAVARDLRRHYGENYRIVRAESGPDALETLNELKLRGETVAVFVADYRMPQMSGIEFLEEAMDIFPMARRVLLTAYADTHAAIDAINVVDLDHYLLKPWDPPEEKLYPVIDALIDAWRATGERAIPHTKIIGHQWNARSSDVREFLARNRLYYTWFRADEPKGKQLLEAADQDGLTLPVVITEQGETLIDPTDAELGATLWADHHTGRGLLRPGGDRRWSGGARCGSLRGIRGTQDRDDRTHRDRWAGRPKFTHRELPGLPRRAVGSQLAERARRQAEKFDAELITAAEVRALEIDGNARTVKLSDGREIGCRAVILAMGVEYRQLPAEGCDGFDRSRCLLRRDRIGSRGLRRRRGVRHRRRQLCRTGRDVSVQDGEIGHDRLPAHAGGLDVPLPGPADPGERQDQGDAPHRGTCRQGRRPPGGHLSGEQRHRFPRGLHLRSHVLFIGAEPRTDWLDGGWRATTTASSSPGPICVMCAAGRRTGRLTIWKQVCRVCLLQEMCEPNPPNGWRRPWAKGRWP